MNVVTTNTREMDRVRKVIHMYSNERLVCLFFNSYWVEYCIGFDGVYHQSLLLL